MEVPVERAFRVFTDQIDDWWIREHHIGSADLERVVIEPREGGRWYEIGVDGSECDWGRVLEWEPPGRLVLAWQISVELAIRPGASRPRSRSASSRSDRTGRGLSSSTGTLTGSEMREDQMRAGFDSEGGWQGSP